MHWVREFTESDDKRVIVAEQIAQTAHKGQIRRDGSPYINHPERIAAAMNTEEQKILAWLHDVIEDTDMILDDLKDLFPEIIIDALDAITHRPYEDYPVYILDRVAPNDLARSVKIQDIIDNMAESPRYVSKSQRDKYLFALRELLLYGSSNEKCIAKVTISEVLNGFIIENEYGKEVIECKKGRIADDSEAIQAMLYTVLSELGIFQSKYNPTRVVIDIEKQGS